MKAIIFTDGSSRGNPGPGGWGAVVIEDGTVKELGGREDNTTNNRMEIRAAVEGLSDVKLGGEAMVYTDSSYLINGIGKWISGWKKNGWKTKAKGEVMNRDLWERLDALVSERKVDWKYVGGHSGIVGNERCDHIATDFADGVKLDLYSGPIKGYDLPNILDVSSDHNLVERKSSSRDRSKARAYSYVSRVGDQIQVHKTWQECEKRVKGVKGARYKKSLSAEDERSLIEEFSAI